MGDRANYVLIRVHFLSHTLACIVLVAVKSAVSPQSE